MATRIPLVQVNGRILQLQTGDTLSIVDTDGTLAANSDAKVASQKATKTYVDSKIFNRVSAVTLSAQSSGFTAAWGTSYVCSGTSYTITLPTASGNSGKVIAIRCTASGTITIDGNSSETVDGRTTLALIAGDYIELISDGTNVQKLVFTHADWVGFTASITGTTTNPTLGGSRTELYSYKRDGRDLLLNFMYRHGSAGSGGSGQWQITLPLSLSVDTAFCATGNWNGAVTAASRNLVGIATMIWYNGTTYVAHGTVFVLDSTHLGMWLTYDGGGTAGSLWNQTTWPFTATEILITFQARIPISGW